MPDCPSCRHPLAFSIDYAICPKCKRKYSPEECSEMPGYDGNEVLEQAAIFALLYSSGALQSGINEVEVFEDGLLVHPYEE